jgi:hypothetical protein
MPADEQGAEAEARAGGALSITCGIKQAENGNNGQWAMGVSLMISQQPTGNIRPGI